MRHHAFERQRFFRENFFDERQGFVPARAVTAHAGVDFQMHGNSFAEFFRDFGERANVVRLIHANGQIMRDAPFEFGFLPFAEQEQRRLDAGVAQAHRFFERAQAKTPRAFLDGDACHVECAVAVSFVLHHGHQAHVLRQIAANELQIAAQFAEVNFGPRRTQRKIFRIQTHQAKNLTTDGHGWTQISKSIKTQI